MGTRTYFLNANLLDGLHPAKPGSSVLVEGNRIVSVGTGAAEPRPGDAVVDCAGKTLMPGMTVFTRRASIPPLEVLKWATVNGGLLFGRDDLGQVAEGFLADIIVVDGDPSDDIKILSDTANITTVMRDGKVLLAKNA